MHPTVCQHNIIHILYHPISLVPILLPSFVPNLTYLVLPHKKLPCWSHSQITALPTVSVIFFKPILILVVIFNVVSILISTLVVLLPIDQEPFTNHNRQQLHLIILSICKPPSSSSLYIIITFVSRPLIQI